MEEPQPVLQSLVVPLDGSRIAETALPVARKLADQLGVGLHLFQAVPTPGQARSVLGWDVSEEEPVIDVDPVKHGQEYLDRVASALNRDGTWTEGKVAVGAAVPSILAYAREKGGSLIVMCTAGSRGIGARWRVGSVAERVIRQSDTPVLLVPPRLAPYLRQGSAATQVGMGVSSLT
jgi:nucleotide-binding universal stress UspA family protein